MTRSFLYRDQVGTRKRSRFWPRNLLPWSSWTIKDFDRVLRFRISGSGDTSNLTLKKKRSRSYLSGKKISGGLMFSKTTYFRFGSPLPTWALPIPIGSVTGLRDPVLPPRLPTATFPGASIEPRPAIGVATPAKGKLTALTRSLLTPFTFLSDMTMSCKLRATAMDPI